MINYMDIPASRDWKVFEPVNKGWSEDKKFHIVTNDNRQLLLRISDISMIERKKDEFEVLKQLDDCDIQMTRPVGFGVCNDGKSVYILLTWLDGIDADEALRKLPAEKQYQLGCEAGRILRKIHQIPTPKNQIAWAERFNRKIDRKIKNYEECEINFEKADRMINYINDNRYLLANRPQTFQHGDFHIGNMIVNEHDELGIIDFNRYDYGDPWEEFNRIVWCAENSSYFASGRINGYFEGDVPEAFFKLMALYIGSNSLSSVPWAIPFGETEVRTMLMQVENVLKWYDDFKSFIPSWYLPHIK